MLNGYPEIDPTNFLEGYPSAWSDCRAFRYTLWRVWGMKDAKGLGRYVQFIGLNPSTADDEQDDPTVRRCIGFAKSWGYDAMCMTNLFAFRATDPKLMKAASDPIGPDNNRWLTQIALEAAEVVGCWGAHGSFRDRDAAVYKLIPELQCLGCNQDADGDWIADYRVGHPEGAEAMLLKWRPSIHMPRWASRLTLEITGVRVERLNAISEADATAEGVDAIPAAPAALTHRTSFAGLWDKINGKRPGCSWADNPWVWCISFTRLPNSERI